MDVESMAELFELADSLGPYIALFKTHIDIVRDFSKSSIAELQRLSTKHNFLIFEDRKLVDIGSTVQKQYGAGLYCIADWAHIVNVVLFPGDGIIDGLEEVARQQTETRAVLILSEMTSKGALDSAEHKAINTGNGNIGDVSVADGQVKNEDMVVLTTRVNMTDRGDSLGQQYQTPAEAIARGADFVIAGRGIYKGQNREEVAKKYQEAGWSAYEKRIFQDY